MIGRKPALKEEGAGALYGLYGNDILIGGAGSDALFGGSGGDLLVGGATAFDEDANALDGDHARVGQQARLRRARGQSAGGRHQPGFGERPNGGVFLQASGPGATALDGGAADYLSGGECRGWFFAALEGPVAELAWLLDGDEWTDPPR